MVAGVSPSRGVLVARESRGDGKLSLRGSPLHTTSRRAVRERLPQTAPNSASVPRTLAPPPWIARWVGLRRPLLALLRLGGARLLSPPTLPTVPSARTSLLAWLAPTASCLRVSPCVSPGRPWLASRLESSGSHRRLTNCSRHWRLLPLRRVAILSAEGCWSGSEAGSRGVKNWLNTLEAATARCVGSE